MTGTTSLGTAAPPLGAHRPPPSRATPAAPAASPQHHAGPYENGGAATGR